MRDQTIGEFGGDPVLGPLYEAVTEAETMLDDFAIGSTLLRNPSDQKPQAKLTEENVRDIRRRCAGGPRGIQRQLAREYGVSPTTINTIVKGIRWTQIQGD